jgi:hypothetical protein
LLADTILLSMLIIATPIIAMPIIATPAAAAPDDDRTNFAAPTDRIASYSPAPVPDDTAGPPVENVRDGAVVERALTAAPSPVAGRMAPLTDLLGVTWALAPHS